MKITRKLWMFLPILFGVFMILLIVKDVVREYNDIEDIIRSRKIVNWCFFFVSFFSFGYFVFCGRRSGFGMRDLKLWPVLGTILLIRGIIVHFSLQNHAVSPLPLLLYCIFHGICLFAVTVFVCIQGVIVYNCFTHCPEGVDRLLVLGTQTGSPVLNQRVDTACGYLLKNQKTLAVCSGGQGSNEPESEAVYMKRRLMNSGISPERIAAEDLSTNTVENVRFSSKYLPEECTLSIVTDDFHIFRSRCIVYKEIGKWPYALPSHSSRITLPHYLFREFLSTVFHAIKGEML